jgi:signal transduction histidine kinase
MMSGSDQQLPGTEELEIPFERVAKFVRQISHDVRNNLGSMDLQAAYATELIADAEAADELRKLRGMISTTAKMLQSISRNFQPPKPNLVRVNAQILLEDFRERLVRKHPEEAKCIEWKGAIGEETVAVDIEMIFTALFECCRNALQFNEGEKGVAATVTTSDGSLVIELAQNRATLDGSPEEWGEVPFRSTRRGGYGLGLFHARQILAAHQGALEFSHDPESEQLTTRIRLPLDEQKP